LKTEWIYIQSILKVKIVGHRLSVSGWWTTRITDLNDFWCVVESGIIVEGIVDSLVCERLPQNTVVGVKADEKDTCVCQRIQAK